MKTSLRVIREEDRTSANQSYCDLAYITHFQECSTASDRFIRSLLKFLCLHLFVRYDFNGYAAPCARISCVYDGGAGPPVAAPARVPQSGRLRGPGTIVKWGTKLDHDW